MNVISFDQKYFDFKKYISYHSDHVITFIWKCNYFLFTLSFHFLNVTSIKTIRVTSAVLDSFLVSFFIFTDHQCNRIKTISLTFVKNLNRPEYLMTMVDAGSSRNFGIKHRRKITSLLTSIVKFILAVSWNFLFSVKQRFTLNLCKNLLDFIVAGIQPGWCIHNLLMFYIHTT